MRRISDSTANVNTDGPPLALVLAPMAGVTDAAVRALARRYGATETVGEMLHSDPRLRDTRKGRTRSAQIDEPSPRIVQLLGNEPKTLAAAARDQVRRGADVIDFNLGCPAKKVCRKAAGSALLADLTLVRACLEALVDAVTVPVTVKIRLGPTLDTINVERTVELAEAAGLRRVAIHARSRACAYRGQARWALAAPAVRRTRLPILINGDIHGPRTAIEALGASGAAGVMIGRAAQGQPWIFREIAAALSGQTPPPRPDGAERLAVLDALLADIETLYGPKAGARIARKHLDAFWRVALDDGLIDPEIAGAQRAGWISADTIDAQRRHIAHLDWGHPRSAASARGEAGAPVVRACAPLACAPRCAPRHAPADPPDRASPRDRRPRHRSTDDAQPLSRTA